MPNFQQPEVRVTPGNTLVGSFLADHHGSALSSPFPEPGVQNVAENETGGRFFDDAKGVEKRNVCQNDAIKNCQQTEHCTISFSEPSDDLKGTSYRRLQHHRIVPQLFMAHLTLSTEAITFLPVSQPVAQNLTSHTCITSAWKSILVVFKGLPRSFGNGFV